MKNVASLVLKLLRSDSRTYSVSLLGWSAFYMSPLLVTAVVKLILDHLTEGHAGTPWTLLAALLGVEVTRWTMLIGLAPQWQGAWVGFNTLPRVNALTSLATSKGPTVGRLPGSSGEAVSRFRDDTHDLAMVLDSWLDLTGVLLSAVIALSVMFAIDARVAAIVAIPPVLAVAISIRLGPRLRQWRRKSRRATGLVTSFIGDSFARILAVKTNGAEDAMLHRFSSFNDSRAEASRQDQMGRAILNSIGSGTGEITVGIVLLVVASAFRSGSLSVGDVYLFASYVTIVSDAPRWLGRAAAWLQQADISIDRLAELMEGDREAPVRHTEVHLRHGPPPLPRPAPAPEPLLEMRVSRLTSVHDSSDHGIIDASLTVTTGQLVVVTGEVGSGKTTLLRAILGVLPTQGGEVRWNGRRVEDPATELVPPLVAYLPQVPRLFSEPLADTILLGLPDADLDRALWLACLEGDVATMAAGVGTVIGPRGLRLSGGQVQRTAAARAFVRRPQLLVIDDLSSALDIDTEMVLWERLALDVNRTALLVSHRPHVLEMADQVIVVERGRIISN